MEDVLKLKGFLTLIENIASGHLYFVGGLVRDLLLRRQTRDIDLAYEGEIEELSNVLKAHYQNSLSKFSTIKLSVGDFNIDIAMVRKDHYPNSDGFAIIGNASIEEDILRRDFTINTAYMILNGQNIEAICRALSGGRPSDFEIAYGHHFFLRDLNNRTLAVLHEKSFEEDPTRLLRAVKYQVSHHFKLDRHTRRYFNEAIASGAIRRVPLNRYLQTFNHLLSLDQWVDALKLTVDSGLFEPYFGFEPMGVSNEYFQKWSEKIDNHQLLKFKYFIIFSDHIDQVEGILGKHTQQMTELLKLLSQIDQCQTAMEEISIFYELANRLKTTNRLVQCALGYILDENFANYSCFYAKLYDEAFNMVPREISMYLGTLKAKEREDLKFEAAYKLISNYLKGDFNLSQEDLDSLLLPYKNKEVERIHEDRSST